jgi:hypothetical protein
MFLNFIPLGWSRWCSPSLKDGILKQLGFQALCSNMFSGVSLAVL